MLDGVQVRALCRPVSSFTKPYGWNHAVNPIAFSWYLKNPGSCVRLQDREVQFIAHFLHRSIQRFVLGDIKFACSCSAIKGCATKLSVHSLCADVNTRAVWEVCSQHIVDNFYFCTMHLSNYSQYSSLTLCGLLLHG